MKWQQWTFYQYWECHEIVVLFIKQEMGMHLETQLSGWYEVHLGKLQFTIPVLKWEWKEVRFFNIPLNVRISWLTSKLRSVIYMSPFICSISYKYDLLINCLYVFYMHESVSAACNVLEIQFAYNNFYVNPVTP